MQSPSGISPQREDDRVDLVRVGVDAAETLRRDVALLLVGPPAPHEILGAAALAAQRRQSASFGRLQTSSR